MKKLMVTVMAVTAMSVFADDAKKEDAKTDGKPVETEESEAPMFWGFANYGWYSGYQLYGSLVNPDPTLQGYAELNFNIPANFGYLGAGVWSNSDLTSRRRNQLRGAFNEWDFNLHYGKTFFFDDDCTWGLDYRTSCVWYYYPPKGKGTTQVKTTFGWDHSFAIVNPFVVPFLDVVHEYTGHGTLLQFGLRRDFQVTDQLRLTPSVTFVWRNKYYGWCFPNYGKDPADGEPCRAGLASGRAQLDATYMFTDWIGVFAKVGYNFILQDELRNACDERWDGAYGCAKEFAWGGFGVCVNF